MCDAQPEAGSPKKEMLSETKNGQPEALDAERILSDISALEESSMEEESTMGSTMFSGTSTTTGFTQMSASDDSAFYSKTSSTMQSVAAISASDPERSELESIHVRKSSADNKVCFDFIFEKIEQLACTMDDESETVKDVLDEVLEYFVEVFSAEEIKKRNSEWRKSFESFLKQVDHIARLIPKEEGSENDEDMLDHVCQYLENAVSPRDVEDHRLIDQAFDQLESMLCGDPLPSKHAITKEQKDPERFNAPLFKISEEGSFVSETSSRVKAARRQARQTNIRKEITRRSDMRKLRGNIHSFLTTRDVVKKVSECRDSVHEAIESAGEQFKTTGVQLGTILEHSEMDQLWDMITTGTMLDIWDSEPLTPRRSATGAPSPRQPTNPTENVKETRDSSETTQSALHRIAEDPEESESQGRAQPERDFVLLDPPEDHSTVDSYPQKKYLQMQGKITDAGRWTPYSTGTEKTCDETISADSATFDGLLMIEEVAHSESVPGNSSAESGQRFNHTAEPSGRIFSRSIAVDVDKDPAAAASSTVPTVEFFSVDEDATQPCDDGASQLTIDLQATTSSTAVPTTEFFSVDEEATQACDDGTFQLTFDLHATTSESELSIEDMPSIPYIQTAESSILVEEAFPLEVEAALVEDGQSVGSVRSKLHKRATKNRYLYDDAPDDELHRPGRKQIVSEPRYPKASSVSLAMIPSGSIFSAIAEMFGNSASWYDSKYGVAMRFVLLVVYIGMSMATSTSSTLRAHIIKRRQQLSDKMSGKSDREGNQELCTVPSILQE
eukprot:Nitzschia sp. Nitz4//scaffold103_size77763//40980//43334//NITZ4_005445-RA/size77763-processed-gene-0.25-mRNA-1//-1//CDS//3329532328//5809//frame0